MVMPGAQKEPRWREPETCWRTAGYRQASARLLPLMDLVRENVWVQWNGSPVSAATTLCSAFPPSSPNLSSRPVSSESPTCRRPGPTGLCISQAMREPVLPTHPEQATAGSPRPTLSPHTDKLGDSYKTCTGKTHTYRASDSARRRSLLEHKVLPIRVPALSCTLPLEWLTCCPHKLAPRRSPQITEVHHPSPKGTGSLLPTPGLCLCGGPLPALPPHQAACLGLVPRIRPTKAGRTDRGLLLPDVFGDHVSSTPGL